MNRDFAELLADIERRLSELLDATDEIGVRTALDHLEAIEPLEAPDA